ncbi:ABC transporter family protein [Giardia duodenalis assemblage B]|uniref:ABC transporter family protein n=1 Tax=Giardia duodenalis assemblage B TaxID=1394984 RepID=A0A132NU28_GIAIN|nr:ABC transporter family protein [Giardia intestinalis assemblage B]
MATNSLDRGFVLQRTGPRRQFAGVFCKNLDLLQRSWYGLVIVVGIVATLMGVIIKVHYFYLSQNNTSVDPNAQIVIGNHDTMPSIATYKDANYNFLFLKKDGVDLGTLSYDSTAENTGYLSFMGMKYPTGYEYKASLRTISDSVWTDGLYRIVTYPYFTDMKKYLASYDYDRTDIYPGGAADLEASTDETVGQVLTRALYSSPLPATLQPSNRAGAANDDERISSLPETIQRLFSHAAKTTEAYRTNNMINDQVKKGFLMHDVPLLAVDVSAQPASPMQVTGTTATNSRVTISSGYKVYGYYKKQTFFVSQNDYLRLLNLQYNMFSINIRALINQIYSISTPSLPTGNIYAPLYAPVIDGNYKQFWRNVNANDVGPDMYTPMYMCFILPFCFFILTPLFSYRLSQEKGEGINHLHYMMGLKYIYRWLGDFVYQLAVTSIIALICVLSSLFGGLNGLKLNTPVAWVPTIILTVLMIPIFSSFVAAFFETGRNSSLVCITIAIVLSVTGLLYGIKYSDLTIIDRSINKWYALIPVFGPVSILTQLQSLAILQTETLYLAASHLRFTRKGDLSPDFVGESVLWSLIFTVISTLFMLVVGMYADLVMPKRKGIPNHWLFFLFPIVYKVDKIRGEHTKHLTTRIVLRSVIWAMFHPDLMCRKVPKGAALIHQPPALSQEDQLLCEPPKSNEHADTSVSVPELPQGTSAVEEERYFDIDSGKHFGGSERAVDSDVITERVAAHAGYSQYNRERALLIRAIDLTKTYPATRLSPEKHAVRGVSFTVAEGECLGLLGPNGAAKTTTINILTMLHRATTGEAYISGLDLTDPDMKASIQNITGICPQFDIQYPTLTCRQHLKYFCRLKRIHRSQEKQHVNDLLEAVGLMEKADTPSKSLSGGMRRRLSVAIALTGSPSVLYLDEPSTGLDPESKRQLWNVILRVRSNRAILLTTHAMDEAEALCNRIFIMVAGQLKCIGTCSYLQRKFGNGYELVFTIKNDFDFSKNSKIDQTEHLLHGLDPEGSPLPETMAVGGLTLNTSREVCGHLLVNNHVSTSLQLIRVFSGRLTYKLPDSIPISQIFMATDQLIRMKPGVITDWCLSRTSLDDVFFKVVLTL